MTSLITSGDSDAEADAADANEDVQRKSPAASSDEASDENAENVQYDDNSDLEYQSASDYEKESEDADFAVLRTPSVSRRRFSLRTARIGRHPRCIFLNPTLDSISADTGNAASTASESVPLSILLHCVQSIDFAQNGLPTAGFCNLA